MRKYVLTNPVFPSYLIYGGLLLVFLRTPLAANDLVEPESFLSGALLGAGSVFVLAGFILRFYHARQNGQQKNFLFSIALGVAVLVALMATGIIHTPDLLQNIL
ncbi:hypothetical protein [Pontibacter cellulosilyticus]|uniref:Uncharacterized protein n=1 Tax=Pontibacter cellulosilyticus TaxID=1720253 RepID=A0A923N678_9BACT|nr:hypothetical protein [Pontibacter cellulosilyticus]MBC5992976.1 hypothetical protein [Pontibacter cellulosilyticus]